MRKPNLFSAVLSLFLLVPASITWAHCKNLYLALLKPANRGFRIISHTYFFLFFTPEKHNV